MATILTALKSLSAYPVSRSVLADVADEFGLNLTDDANVDVRYSAPFLRAKARVYRYLSEAPNVTQGGQSYTLDDKQRGWYRAQAEALLNELGEGEQVKPTYGYKGSRL